MDTRLVRVKRNMPSRTRSLIFRPSLHMLSYLDCWSIEDLARVHRMLQNRWEPLPVTGLRVCNENLIFLFLNQNICCGYSKEPSL